MEVALSSGADLFDLQISAMAPVATETNDGRSKDRMTNYTSFWDGDMKKNNDSHNENRLSSYTELVNGAYDSPDRLGLTLDTLDVPRLLRRCHHLVRVRLGRLFPFLPVQ